MFSSTSNDKSTPKEFYKELNKEFKFDFDPCPLNAKFDGLTIQWGRRNFVNPPYGRQIKLWIRKGWEQARYYDRLVVFLLASRTDTYWWHNYIMDADEIRFIKGRLKFSNHKNSAPFPSCIAIFRGKKK